MKDFYDYTYDALHNQFLKLGLTRLDTKRVYPWIYKKRAKSINDMTDVPAKVRKTLEGLFLFGKIYCRQLVKSVDGTMKALLELKDGNTIENVLIKDNGRNTLCISTQVGCQMGCKFCNTGTQGFVRNLTSGELMSQYLYWNDLLAETNESITNIVIMGMGEPFANYENLCNWLTVMLDPDGINMSRHRITVSTSGIIDKVLSFGKEFKVELAISLHASNNETRSKIMPINKIYNIERILDTVKDYPKVSNTNYVTFEYLMLRGINDSIENAKELHKLLANIPCKVNLIMYNEWPGDIFKRSDGETVLAFQRYLKTKGIMCTIRKSKGNDVYAACGQLKSQQI